MALSEYCDLFLQSHNFETDCEKFTYFMRHSIIQLRFRISCNFLFNNDFSFMIEALKQTAKDVFLRNQIFNSRFKYL